MSMRIKNSSRPIAPSEENQITEKSSNSIGEIIKEAVEGKSDNSSATASKSAEHSLEGLARQIGLFKYALPNEQLQSEPQKATTLAVGEEDSGFDPNKSSGATTMAVGEEDGGYDPNKPSGATTMAVGEEDGGYRPAPKPEPTPTPTKPSGATTMAVGEEDGGFNPSKPSGGAITMAVGEDGGFSPTDKGGFTTLATGEEDSSK